MSIKLYGDIKLRSKGSLVASLFCWEEKKMDAETTCPYCGHKNITTAEMLKELQEVGKAVVDCELCKTWYLLRDDGDGQYVTR